MDMSTEPVAHISTRRGSIHNRCPHCRINFKYCFCADLLKVDLKTKIYVLIHIREQILTSNTTILTKLSLPADKIEVQTRGEKDGPLDFSFLNDEQFEYLYLYPSKKAEILDKNFLETIKKPIRLVVPDGSWRQASRFHKREESIKNLRHVKIESDKKSLYHLRRQKFETGLCTHEAIARALGLIEGHQIEEKLLYNLKLMVKSTLRARSRPIPSELEN